MYENMKTLLIDWNATTSERQKLQHAYLVIAFAVVMLAGLISLIDADLGQTVVRVALVAVIIFVANALVWSVLLSAVITKLPIKAKKK